MWQYKRDLRMCTLYCLCTAWLYLPLTTNNTTNRSGCGCPLRQGGLGLLLSLLLRGCCVCRTSRTAKCLWACLIPTVITQVNHINCLVRCTLLLLLCLLRLLL